MPRTANLWPRSYSLANLRAVARARLAGATVSLNQVKLADSTVRRNALVMEHALVWGSDIGRYAIVGRFASLFLTSLGPYSAVAEKAVVGAAPHWPELATTHVFPVNEEFGFYSGPWPAVTGTTIGADTWIGAGATVRGGLRIGHGAVVGAGAVVTRDVADYEVVAGVPARRLRFRFDEETMARLLRLAWWDWPPERLREHLELFREPLTPGVLDRLEAAAPTPAAPLAAVGPVGPAGRDGRAA
jgi:acetyltransferase-like isoleucine patch superfamily enzyme